MHKLQSHVHPYHCELMKRTSVDGD